MPNEKNKDLKKPRRKRGVIEIIAQRDKGYYFRIQSLINGITLAKSVRLYKTSTAARKGVYAMLNIVFDQQTEIIWPKTRAGRK